MSDRQPPGRREASPALAAACPAAPDACQPVRLAASLDGPRDAPVLVLGNSLGTTRELWEPQLAVLGEHFRLLRYEHRGHGGSPAPPGPYTIAELGADVLRLLDDFGIEHASYCGVSLGGMIGMWLAANAPGRIDALGAVLHLGQLPGHGPLGAAGGDRAGRRPAVHLRPGGEPLVHAGFAARFPPSRPPSSPPWTTLTRKDTRAAARPSRAWTCGRTSRGSPRPRW